MSKVELLLQKRFKVVADFPWKPAKDTYNVGDIITIPNDNTYWRDQVGDPVYMVEYQNYPHLFKPLEWWQERKDEELPDFVMMQGSIISIATVKMFGYLTTGLCTPYDMPYDEED